MPRVSIYVDDFTHFDFSVALDSCVFGICVPGIFPHATINTDLLGGFNFDFWDLGGGPLNFLGDPDYIASNPWDFWPLFHSQDDHLFPFS